MRISRYEIFLKTVELGSLTAAAEYYSYTQSAISQIINSLEAEFGMVLLSRNRTGSVLTSEGQQLMPYIREIGSSHHNLSERVFELLGLRVGFIKIGTLSSVSCHWLPMLIKGFQQLYPNIQFEIHDGTYTEIETLTLDGVVDFGFVRLPTVKGLDTLPIKRDPLLVVIPENHPYAECEIFPLEALSQESFIYLTEGDVDVHREIFKTHHLSPNIQYRVKDDYTAMSMVESGFGLSILPQLVLTRTPYRILAKRTDPPYYRNLGVAMRDKKKISLAVKYFLNYMIMELSVGIPLLL